MSHLWERFLSEENFYRAWRAVRKNIPRPRRQTPGPDGISLAYFERNLQHNLQQLRHELAQGAYRPSPIRQVRIPKPDGSTRTLTVLSVRDRVAQRAALQVLVPIWEPIFLPVSFGFRPGRSPQSAVAYLQKHRTPERGWVLHADIAQCFDSIHHSLLLQMLGQKIREARMLRLIQMWLEAGMMQAVPEKLSFTHRFSRLKALRTQAMALMQEVLRETLWHWGMPMDENVPDMFWNCPEPFAPSWRTWVRHSFTLLLSWLFPRARRWWKEGKTGWQRYFARLEPEHIWGALFMIAVAGWAISLSTRLAPRDEVGILQGSPLSPLLANVYLHPFDVAMVRKGWTLVRFADDWVVCASDLAQLRQAWQDARTFLARLHLKVQPHKTRWIPPEQGFTWLGLPVPPAYNRETRSG